MVHPHKPGTFLAGIECDGATYHRSATARDRDKIREEVLRGLGWEILRIWSPDWWHDKAGATERLHMALEALVVASQAKDAQRDARHQAGSLTAEPASADEMPRENEDVIETEAGTPDEDQDAVSTADLVTQPEAVDPAFQTVMPADTAAATFRKTDLSEFKADPDAFYEFSYRSTIDHMVAKIVETEAPVRDDVVAQRIARAHGWLRTGSRIRGKIERHLRPFDFTHDSAGRFIWPKGEIVETVSYRPPASEDDRRPVTDIALQELVGLVQIHPEALDEPDPALVLARLMALERLAASSRARIDEAITMSDLGARTSGA